MKKIFVFMTLLLIGSVLAGCGQAAVGNSPTATSTLAPVSTTQPVHQEDTPNQLHFYSFETLKEVDQVMQGDPEVLEAYYEEHMNCLACYSAGEALTMFQDLKTVRIPYPNKGDCSLVRLDHNALHRGTTVWYDKEHFRYKFSILNDTSFWGTEEEIREFYQTKEVVYRQQGEDYVMLVRENDEDEDERILYIGNVFFEDVQIVFTVERIKNEDGQWEDDGNVQVDLNGLSDFDFITVGDVLTRLA